uniref:Uncharacterized protein n=1 Tax=Medicago truncatula TaxID=3880 RepID=I3SY94_MEDTR|nr:unknown [Medicago truncatula]
MHPMSVRIKEKEKEQQKEKGKEEKLFGLSFCWFYQQEQSPTVSHSGDSYFCFHL